MPKTVKGKASPSELGPKRAVSASLGEVPAGAAAKPPDPARIFSIPADVKYLQVDQLTALTESFRAWRQAARGPARRQARGRVWLAYLLLRFTAARLGEVLALDDRSDLNLAKGTVIFGRGGSGDEFAGRQVQVPEDVAREMAGFLNDPVNRDMRGRVFHLDQGYIRRLFYARAADCGLPRELANPRVLRNSRAIEMLRQGIPLTIVQNLLGQGTANLTASYLTFAQADRERIVSFHLQKETRLRTSARNSFQGRIVEIKKGLLLTRVELTTTGGYRLVSVITNDSLANLGLRRGMPVCALVKAPWVIIARGQDAPRVSASNRLRGLITKINADVISCEVIVALPDGTQVCALITINSARDLGLEVGGEVWTVFKSSAVIITVD